MSEHAPTSQVPNVQPRCLVIERRDPARIARYRAMTPAQKVQIAFEAFGKVRRILKAHFRDLTPKASDEALELAVSDKILSTQDSEDVFVFGWNRPD